MRGHVSILFSIVVSSAFTFLLRNRPKKKGGRGTHEIYFHQPSRLCYCLFSCNVLPFVLQIFPELKNQSLVTRNINLRSLNLNLQTILHFKLKKRGPKEMSKWGILMSITWNFNVPISGTHCFLPDHSLTRNEINLWSLVTHRGTVLI